MIDERNKKRSLPFGLKFSARLRGVDPHDVQNEVASCLNGNKRSRTLKALVMGGAGGQFSRHSGPAWNYDLFFGRFERFRKKEPELCYEVTDLNDCIEDEEDDEELTVASKKQTEKAAHRIINIHHLWHAMKGTVCKCCAEQREHDICGNVADEFATYLEKNNINIPSNVISNFKRDYKIKRKPQPSIRVKEEHVGIATKIEIICDAHTDHSQVIEPEHSRLYGTKRDGKRNANEMLSWYSVTINWFCQ